MNWKRLRWFLCTYRTVTWHPVWDTYTYRWWYKKWRGECLSGRRLKKGIRFYTKSEDGPLWDTLLSKGSRWH